ERLVDAIQLDAAERAGQGLRELRIECDRLILGHLDADGAQASREVAGDRIRHGGRDLLQGLVVGDQLQDHLAILLEPLPWRATRAEASAAARSCSASTSMSFSL